MMEVNNHSKERTEYIGIRATPEEKELLKRLAAAAGVSLTGFLAGSALGDKIESEIVKSRERKKKTGP